MSAMKMKSRSRQCRTAAEKAALVAAYRRSGLSLRHFARQHGVALSNIQRWARQQDAFEPSQGSAALVEVPNLLASRPAAGAYRLHFRQGLGLEVARGFDVGEVRALAELLHSL